MTCSVRYRLIQLPMLLLFIVRQFRENPLERRQICTEVNRTVAHPAAHDDNSAAVCLGVPRFAAGKFQSDANPMRSQGALYCGNSG